MRRLTYALVLLLGACSSNNGDGLDERERIVAELAISGATVRFVDGKADRAEKVKQVSAAVRVAIDNGSIDTTNELRDYLVDQIPTGGTLNPYEIEAARAIVALIMVDLEEFVPPSGVLDPETKALVLRYASAVDRGADASIET